MFTQKNPQKLFLFEKGGGCIMCCFQSREKSYQSEGIRGIFWWLIQNRSQSQDSKTSLFVGSFLWFQSSKGSILGEDAGKGVMLPYLIFLDRSLSRKRHQPMNYALKAWWLSHWAMWVWASRCRCQRCHFWIFAMPPLEHQKLASHRLQRPIDWTSRMQIFIWVADTKTEKSYPI